MLLLLDALNTPLSDQVYVRRRMVQYLHTIPPGTRIAVFTLGSHLRIIEGFTTDFEHHRKGSPARKRQSGAVAGDGPDLRPGAERCDRHCGWRRSDGVGATGDAAIRQRHKAVRNAVAERDDHRRDGSAGPLPEHGAGTQEPHLVCRIDAVQSTDGLQTRPGSDGRFARSGAGHAGTTGGGAGGVVSGRFARSDDATQQPGGNEHPESQPDEQRFADRGGRAETANRVRV
jgi:hypothetical protein